MERLRADLLRRANLTRATDEERASDRSVISEMSERQPSSPSQYRPAALTARLFARGARAPSTREDTRPADHIESPKSPDFERPIGLNLPRPLRGLVATSVAHPVRPSAPTSRSRQTLAPDPNLPSPPAPAVVSIQHGPGGHLRIATFDSPDPAELHLAQLGQDGRHRRERRERQDGEIHSRRHRHGDRHGRRRKSPPKRFLCCLPWVKSRRLRSRIVTACISGFILVLLLAVYLSLSVTHLIPKGTFTIVFILVVLFATVFFCHSVVRLCILVFRGDRSAHRSHQLVCPGGYAVPREPIPVVVAGDEESVGANSTTSKVTPPAYGLWRGSVRVDPDRLFWKRNEAMDGMPTDPETGRGPRPPSYSSEDGISYVVDAAPRSTAPTVDVPLPPHPSEAGRLALSASPW